MPTIAAVLHTTNDALRLGRALETLYPCDEILVVDHGSTDATVQVAREYGARVVEARATPLAEHYFRAIRQQWVLCLDPFESVTESLAASLYEWKSRPSLPGSAFSLYLREETAAGWVSHPSPQTRLVPVEWTRWRGVLPLHDQAAPSLEGEILRFAFP